MTTDPYSVLGVAPCATAAELAAEASIRRPAGEHVVIELALVEVVFRPQLDGLAVLVEHIEERQLVLLRIGIFDVADRALGLHHVVGDAFVALGADANWKLHRSVGTYLGLPVSAGLRQIVGPHEGGARTVGTVDHGDRRRRQVGVGVVGLDRRVVPFGNLAKEDVAQHLAVQLHLAGSNALDVDHRNGAANHGGKLKLALGLEDFVRLRHVGCTEIHRFGINLFDACARSDRLVVDLDASGLVVICRPFCIYRRRKSGPGTGNFLCACQRSKRHRSKPCSGDH